MAESAKSDLCEDLVSLYLRLNGFFTSGFVVHAPLGQGNISEIDVLAVRFPLHREPEREFAFEGDPLLRLSHDLIEFAICEVKTGTPKIQCNRALRESPDGISRLLRWLGVFDDEDIKRLLPQLMEALQPKAKQTPEEIVTLQAKENIRIRFYFFAPDRDKPRPNQAFFIGGPSVIAFIALCLSTRAARAACATNYGAGQWGRIAPLVDFFKKWQGDQIPDLQDLCNNERLRALYSGM